MANKELLIPQKTFFTLLTFLLLLIQINSVKAQNIATYTFSGTAGSYSNLSSPTTPALTFGDADEGYFNGIPIGFEFIYMGVPYTTVSASTNGWITLGANITNALYVNSLTTGGAPRPVLAALWDDLSIQSASNVSYKTTGTTPNRIFTIEYKNVNWDYNYFSLLGPCLSFQTRLYETTGKVEFTYTPGDILLGPNSASASIGITGISTGSGNFLSLNGTGNTPTASSTTETATLSSRPPNGRLYTFTPSTIVPASPTALTFSAVTSNSMTLNWTDNASNETNFIIYRSTDNVTFTYSSQVAANTTSSVQTGLLSSTTYYWRVFAVTEARISTAAATGSKATCWSSTLVPTSNAISYYKLEGNANDASGNFNHGTLQNAPSTTTDRFGIANKAYLFNGTNQYVSTSKLYVNPNNLTVSIWFKTSSVTGGKLIGFGSVPVGGSFSFDRHIYMNNSGQLLFGVNPGTGRKTITSPLTYNDGNWHHAAASLSSTNGIKLYVDGALVVNDATPLAGETYNGYWKIGYDEIGATWPSNPTNTYFSGSLDDVLIYQTELSSTQVNTLYSAPDGTTSNSPVCPGSVLNLSTGTIAGATYSWAGPNSFAAASQNPTLTYSTLYPGTYTVTVSQGGCTETSYTVVKTNTALAGQWTGSTDNNWSTVGNWCNSALPTIATDVVIPGTAPLMPNITATSTARNLTVSASATLTKTSAGVLNIYGNFINNGTFTDNGIYTDAGVVQFTGSTPQSITGNTTFNNVTLNNTNGLTLNSTVTVNGILELTAGTLTTNANLNKNLYNGAISGTGAGATSGTIKFFKTIWGDRYHYISSPIGGMTAGDLDDDVTIKFGANRNLFSYNELIIDTNKLAGWTPFVSLVNSLQSMTGYALFFPRFIYNTTVDISGSYSHSTTYTNALLSNTASAKATSDGWNLMGNPYPSTIDWNAAAGWTKTGLDNAIYTWDGRTNRFVSYVNGVGTNGGTPYIGSMQAFFVKVTSAGSGTLGMTNAVRVTSTLRDVWRTENEQEENQLVRLTVSKDSLSDETVIRFTENATVDFDSEQDAYKLLNGDTSPSLFSLSPGADYSINSLPKELTVKTIPLQLNVMTNGVYTWNADLSGFDNGDHIFLEDRLLDTAYNISEHPVLNMTLVQGEEKGRFFIQYAKREALVTGTGSKHHSGNIEINAVQQNVFLLFTDHPSGTADIAVFDAVGKKVYALENASIDGGRVDIHLPDANTGIYVVKAQTSATSKTQQVLIQK